MGAAAGCLLTALAFIAVNAAAHREALRNTAPLPPPPHPAASATPGTAVAPAPPITFYKDLVHPEAEQARRERELERAAAAARR